jgi:hypothetical protein
MTKRALQALTPLLFFLALCLAPVAARAQAPSAAAGGDGWQKVETQMLVPGESYEATTLVSAAYGFIWVMVAGFVLTVWRRSTAVERELQSLRRRIDERAAAGSAAERRG